MGTILASALISRAQDISNDVGGTRWDSSEWLRWLNDGQREIATIAPDSYSKTANCTLVAGTKQTVPSDCIFVMRPIRNMGVGGATPGEPIRPVDQLLLDQQRPSWHTDTATLVVKHFIYDKRVPGEFYVYPPMSGTTTIELAYAAVPAAVAATGAAITLDDTFANPLLDYMLYRAFLKDVEIDGMPSRAAVHKQAFMDSLGLASKAQDEDADK